ncbi:RNA polymerase sigma factor RpoE [Actinokineospora spheciospongiae]|uniref:RNA polymerase sigma factor RpoE n=1 Tax=Actinokineospora spheciospongiae TaxID=909613 RepID=W7IYU6_9PSEU|nr:sigma-70 family RNA polymerase sigma factor [Actinokineospora spheciospongiae]EWC61661.1 RNA polymerase sigma factor RpoE [Actinokineospora spheciospongiae]
MALDPEAFDDLVRAHTDRMYRVALRLCGDPAEAEDVVQDAWIAAWRGRASFRGDAAVSTWLYRVVTNTAMAHLRRRRPTVALDEVPAGRLTDAQPSPEAWALLGERASAVHRAIATLEPSQRVPLVLRELEGLSYKEVAGVLQVSVSVLHKRLYRARVALLAKLEELR